MQRSKIFGKRVLSVLKMIAVIKDFGIMLYGLDFESEHRSIDFSLFPVMSLDGVILHYRRYNFRDLQSEVSVCNLPVT